MKKIIFIVLSLSMLLIFSGCKDVTLESNELSSTMQTESTEVNAVYKSITAEKAKNIMDEQTNYIILDVRTESEFAEGHINGAILIPDYDIGTKVEEKLPNKESLILVYCRSGRRSQLAAKEMVKLGYTNVLDFGGIVDWPYEIVK